MRDPLYGRGSTRGTNRNLLKGDIATAVSTTATINVSET